MASVTEGNRTLDVFRKDEFEKSSGGIRLRFATPRAKTMELDGPARGSARRYLSQFGGRDIGGIEPEPRIHPSALQEAADFPLVARDLQVPGCKKGCRASPLSSGPQDARAVRKVGWPAEAFESEPPLLPARVFSLAGWEPETGDAVELGANMVVDAIRNEDRNVIDETIAVRVLRQPESMGMRRVFEWMKVAAAAGNLPRRSWDPAARFFVPSPAELRKCGKAHEFADLDGIFDARPGPAGEEEPRHRRRIRLGVRTTPPNGAARRNPDGNVLRPVVHDLASGGGTTPTPVLIVGRVEHECIDESRRQSIHAGLPASERLRNFGLDLIRRKRFSSLLVDPSFRFGDQPVAFGGIRRGRKRSNETYGVTVKARVHGTAVRFTIPLRQSFALRPALCPAQISDCLGEIGRESEKLRVQHHLRPHHHDSFLLW